MKATKKSIVSLTVKVAKADKAKSEAKAAAPPAESGPQLVKPTAPLKLRAKITPQLVARIQAEAEAADVGEVEIGMPFAIYFSEAIEAAVMVDKYWEPASPKLGALSRYAARIGSEVAVELVHLVDLAESAWDEAKQADVIRSQMEVERARYVLRELRLGVELVVDDGVRDEKDVMFESLQKEHETEPRTISAIASALGGYARFAKKLAKELAEIPDFDVKLLAEAELLRDALRVRGTLGEQDVTARAARDLRNAYLELIRVRLARVRKVVRYAFRANPEIVREATSAYVREKRRTDRKPEEGGTPDDSLPTPADGEGSDD